MHLVFKCFPLVFITNLLVEEVRNEKNKEVVETENGEK
jgi:hypothetical protein